MSDHATKSPNLTEKNVLGINTTVPAIGSAVVGVVLLLVAKMLAGDHTREWALGYLMGFGFFTAISLGAIFFVVVQHVTKAGWSVSVRRVAEIMAANIVTMGILAIGVVFLAGEIYPWTHMGPEVLKNKYPWLSHGFFGLRVAIYFVVLSIIAWYYYRTSLKQDKTGDRLLTLSMQKYSYLSIALFGLITTYFAWDMIMSTDPVFYSTIYGVYIFAGGTLAFFATIILILKFLQKRGLLAESVSNEHFHDLGKYMFAFVFFWGYIAFSQYMLIWYGNLPEETQWYDRRGATEHPSAPSWWVAWSVLLLFIHFLIPFPGLLSRWSKRISGLLVFWCVWILVAHFIDWYWLVMPEIRHSMDGGHGGEVAETTPFLVPLFCWAGVGGLWKAGLLAIAGQNQLVPTGDPRLGDAVAFENF